MAQHHSFLERNALICLAGMEPELTAEEAALLDQWALRGSALGGWGGQPAAVPWLRKWAALVCKFMEFEKQARSNLLRFELSLSLPDPAALSPEST